ncbi:hypothetical protein [uncultured Kordia sp.]|uniref:hypothetical protein n=1 Tax=uncultured Kordia sp. TaxID=507699 RepID=UPI00261D876A|nr:hypothetical protein [uncultured Kordia sp.]
MKKRNLKLNLGKKSISSFTSNEVTGGGRTTRACTVIGCSQGCDAGDTVQTLNNASVCICR